MLLRPLIVVDWIVEGHQQILGQHRLELLLG
jgi:hypothetical protein